MERVLADLREEQIRRGVHRSTVECKEVTTDYIEAVDENPKASRRRNSPGEILGSIERFCPRALELTPAQS